MVDDFLKNEQITCNTQVAVINKRNGVGTWGVYGIRCCILQDGKDGAHLAGDVKQSGSKLHEYSG